MTINDQKSITMFRAYKLMTDSVKALRDNLKRTVPDLDGLELEQVSGRLHHLSVLLNGLYGILGYDSPDEAFADVVDYEIVDQLKWLQVLRNQIGRKCYNLGYKEQNMLYISGIPALNIPCPTLDTSGDWHRSGLNWSKVPLWDSDLSFWGDWGIQSDIYIRELDGYFNVADTLRACIDMVASGNFCRAQGMKDDYICNDAYNIIVFDKILSLKSKVSSEKWSQIDGFMRKEYRLDWVRYSDRVLLYPCP